MALTLANMALASGLTLANPLIVVYELNVSNNVSRQERLEIAATAQTGEGAPASEYQVTVTNGGATHGNYTVAVFMDRAAFDVGKPPVEVLRDGTRTKIYSVNLSLEEYQGMDARAAAYAHLAAQPEFEGAVVITDIEM